MGSVLSRFAPPQPVATQTAKESATAKASENAVKPDQETNVKASEKTGGTEPESKPPVRQVRESKEYTEQCGLVDDEDKFTRPDPPMRIKTTLATPAQLAKYRSLLDMCFTKESLNGERVLFNPQDVADVMAAAEDYFKSEPVLIEDVPFGVTIVGDLHGQLHDLYRVFDCRAKDGKPGYECSKFLFLGNYVDRGRQSVEVVMAIFCLKMLYPDDFFVLRGNHEFARINVENGFYFELVDRYGEVNAPIIFNCINGTFNYLSIAAIVGDIYFCVHAGISPRDFTRDQLRGLKKPFIECGDDVLVMDMTWSDPAIGLRGTAYNKERACSIYFGLDALVQALSSIECVAVLRGHSLVDGINNQQWGLCITVFSATAHNGDFNDAACVYVEADGTLTLHMIPVDYKRALRDHIYFGKELEGEKEGNVRTTEGGDACGGKSGIATVEDE